MFSTKTLSLPVTALLFSFLGAATASAQSTTCYTRESVEGSWAIITNYANQIALVLGQGTVDADGKLNRAITINVPTLGSTTGERTISTGTNVGTFDVNCDGTGIVTRLLTSSTGVVSNQIDDFQIAAAVEKDGKLIATQITTASRVPAALVPGGVFASHAYTRRPDVKQGQCYTNESLQGNYAVTVQYGLRRRPLKT